MITVAIPEPGQIVTVRKRKYVVTNVAPSTLPGDPLRPNTPPQHLLSLNCIEDDGLGETLDVIWELEPGAAVDERVGLPQLTGFDPPRTFEAFLNAVRWGAISASDDRTLQAPFRSGIEIEDYQLDPLVRAVQMPRVNLLIADDVGLGKTIESGLVIQELIVRNRARTVLIVCPSSLQLQWRDQMREKFGLEFRIVDADAMRELRRSRGIHANPWTSFPRLITSVDYLKRDRPMRWLREVLPADGESRYPRKFDILVVDEAHNVAPSGRGKYATDSQRTAALRLLAPHFEHRIFLSATPHNGYRESFSALLELLDDQRFARDVDPDPVQLSAVMVRRLKSELKRWDGQARFPVRHVEPIEVAYTAEERQAHDWLSQYAALRAKNALTDGERFAAEFVLKLLKKRLFSSTAAFANTLAQHRRTMLEARPAPQAPKLSVLREMLDEEVAEEAESGDAAQESQETTTRLAAAAGAMRALTPEERALLDKLSAWAESASRRADSKAQALLAWLRDTIKPNGVWSNERVIVFTEYRDTQKWLQGELAAHGLADSEHLKLLYGGQDPDEREAVKAAFQASPADSAVRILLATDAASEGIDLQNHCHRVIHYEIPWNPNRLEQRNGRIDRHGQKHDPLIYHFVAAGYNRRAIDDLPPGSLEADLEFLMRAAHKIEQIREDLGKVGPVIAEQVQAAMLGKRRTLDTKRAESDAAPVRQLLKQQRDLQRDVDRYAEQLRETRQTLDLTPANVQAVVETALALAGQPPLAPVPDQPDGPAFKVPALSGSWSECAIGLSHPHTGVVRPIVFDHELAAGRDDRVLAHLNHRLVQKSLRLLRAAIWSTDSTQGLHRFSVRLVPAAAFDTPLVVAQARLVVVGGNAHRLHEELIAAGGEIRDGRFRRLGVTEIRDALAAAGATGLGASAQQAQGLVALQDQLRAVWPSIEDSVLKSLDARARDRATGMQGILNEREHRERTNMSMIMGQLERAIREALADDDPQIAFEFNEEEFNQRRMNRDALRRRLDEIPGELQRELAQIAARFTDPTPRMFPVAVTFLVPDRLARSAGAGQPRAGR